MSGDATPHAHSYAMCGANFLVVAPRTIKQLRFLDAVSCDLSTLFHLCCLVLLKKERDYRVSLVKSC